ncbi:retrovirus-related Pol polyprotein from transposon TNT 1-94 [Trifolium pratense]|uniref:Retrovirus-related Pol polyprotein from transposon TNT 1-94 n=1 Tax=Trifolium pratense TaxID=57577 RepID=A0A2K3NY25_TRIPR|nr:retrovirus-related Pol polyprotein from transposon TNT 1-94 [Trifolium pratense]
MAESSNFMQPSIPRFDGHYDHWSMLMENLLRSKEYWSLIENEVTIALAGATQEQQKAADHIRLIDLKHLIMATHMTLNKMFVIKAPVIVPHCLKVSKNNDATL